MECNECGKDGKMYLHSKCHTEDPVWAILDEEKSELEIICSVREKLICKLKVIRLLQP